MDFDAEAPRMITSAPFMSRLTESDFAAAVIDGLRFAAAGERMAGSLSLARLTRLEDVLVDRQGLLECAVAGFRTVDALRGERLGLALNVKGRLALRCQRCLAEVAFDCAIDARLWLVPPGAAWPEDDLEDDTADAIPASTEMSVLSLIEDEVLLALPIAPRHADCRLPVNAATTQASTPFAALADWMKH